VSPLTLRTVGLSDKGIVQLIHLVSDFASYNRLNLALATDYDSRDMWRAGLRLAARQRRAARRKWKSGTDLFDS